MRVGLAGFAPEPYRNGPPSRIAAKADGTSQAAPFVAGAVALYAARYPEASPTQIREAILSTAKRTKSLEGLVGTNGRLSIKAALAHPPE